MANIIDYLKWRGDLSFKQVPLNEVDKIILARVSYLPFKEIVLDRKESIEAISNKMKNIKLEKFIWKEDKEFVIKLGESNRYKDLKVTDYIEILDLNVQKQFAAVTIWLPHNVKYISFRGTDMSLVGWKEDFNMSFMKHIPSQKEALKYLNEIGKKYKTKLIIGGHSKGGNLAIYSAIYCNDKIKNRIIEIINADGPGFDKEIISSEQYKQILKKINTYVPQSSIIGRLLEHEEQYTTILSTQKGLLQHDIFSWQLDKKDLIHVPDLTDESKILNKAVKNWLENTTSNQRKNFINIIYDVIINSKAQDINDFSVDRLKKITNVLKSYRNIDTEDKREIEEMIKLFFESTIRSIKENKKERVSKV